MIGPLFGQHFIERTWFRVYILETDNHFLKEIDGRL